MDADVSQQWIKRLDALGRAQSHLLWILLVVGLFFLGVHFQVFPSAGEPPESVAVPLVQVTLSSKVIWASGPAVLFLLILATFGSLRAYRTAWRALRLHERRDGSAEPFDVYPNLIDLAAYTTRSTPRSVRWVLGLSYPFVLSLFVLEGLWLLAKLLPLAPDLPGGRAFLLAGLVLGTGATVATLQLWYRRVFQIR